MSESEEAVAHPHVPLPRDEWTEQEEYVWTCVARGEIANLLREYPGSYDPQDARNWPEERVLRPGFLYAILFSKPFRGSVGRSGVVIVGALFRRQLDLSDGRISFPLSLQRCRLDRRVSYQRLHSSGYLSVAGSTFIGTLDMTMLQVDGSLYMSDGVFAKVDLHSARIGDALDMIGSKFTDELIMYSAQIGSSLFMRSCRFQRVDLLYARVGDMLTMSGSAFAGQVDMGNLQVEVSLIMRDRARFEGDVFLTAANVKGTLDIHDATFCGVLDMQLATVGVIRDRGAAWPRRVRLENFKYATWDERHGRLV
jgi:hypothetical protein